MPATIVAVGIDDRTSQLLTTTGHSVERPSYSERSIFERLVSAPADALILGSRTDLDGDFVQSLREERVDTPAIKILPGSRKTWRWAHECARFLDSGGDDVIAAPAHPEEVAASIRTVCRRSRKEPDRIVQFKSQRISLEVNLTKSHAFINGTRWAATAYEWLLLSALASATSPLTRKDLCERLGWTEDNSFEVRMSRLRKHLGPDILPRAKVGQPSMFAPAEKRGYQLLGRVH